MSEGIPYADIVILALIAGFILLRLRSVLGNKSEGEPPNFFKKETPPAQVIEPIVQLDRRSLKAAPAFADEDPQAASLNSQQQETLASMRTLDPQFSLTAFVDGAKMAYEMVFDAFVKGDRPTLKMLLSEPIYQSFAAELDARGTAEDYTETTLVSVSPREVTELTLDRNTARITVRFESEQVSLQRNKQGEIVGGDASEITHAEDQWTFERDLSSKSPNWKIIET